MLMMRGELHFLPSENAYPSSQSMISALYNNIAMYKSKNDIAKKYNLFSKELQQSFYGQKIYQYITRTDTTFINQYLFTWDTGLQEAIVQDSTKYNLIMFSASWCQPCIRQIPDLKEIHQIFGQNMIMTYVSMDDERAIEAWQTKMRMHEIPWRSLMSMSKAKAKAVHDDYGFWAVPYFILVHPNDMKFERLNFDIKNVKQRLHELLKY
jgi:thiol-disulfide isomerase/thioredoxin